MGEVATALCSRGACDNGGVRRRFPPLTPASRTSCRSHPQPWRAGNRALYFAAQMQRKSPTSHSTAHCPPLDLQFTRAFTGGPLLMGARTTGPSGRADFVVRADYRFGLRRKETIILVDHQKAKLLCSFRLNAGRALRNESARQDGSDIGLDVEANAVLAGVNRPSNETRGPLNEAPSFTERYESTMSWEAAHAIDDAIPVSEQAVEGAYAAQQIGIDKQDTDATDEVTRRKQKPEKGSGKQGEDGLNDVPQRSLEEAFGLLKEQVEADKRVQLANNEGTEAESITDTPKPLKRSKIIAKQVISQSSARAIGFVSQLWVSERLCKVVALEVRPSLLSGEIDRVFLADVCQIGDVVLVNDESALENEMTALNCETLVGYDVITEDGNYVGKIRDYSFDLQDGKLTSLDFDSVGFSLVPSSLISTYRLDVDEVIEVLPDSILVKGGAESRIKRLSKGFWQLPSAGEKRRSQKMARSRMLKRNSSKDEDMLAQSRQLPPSMTPRFFEEAELEGLDVRAEPGDRRSLPRGYGGLPPRYRSR
eukprot:c23558_g1_i1 orf=272-1882(+)